MRVLEVQGSPSSMGEQFGEAVREELREFYQRRVQNALASAREYGKREASEAELLAASRASLDATRGYHPAGMAELEGIARGAGMTVEEVLATNGLTDFRDVLSWPYADSQLDQFGGCSAFVAAGDMTSDGQALCGQTWDLATDNMPFVLGLYRRPKDGPRTWCLTTVGCLSLIGLNEAGVGVGTTNLRTTDPRPGVVYLSILHKMLEATTLAEAERAVVEAPRAGAHYYFATGPEGGSAVIECSARQAVSQRIDSGFYAHCNHALTPQVQALEPRAPNDSTLKRTARLTSLLERARGGMTVADAKAFMADAENGESAILRDDYSAISTNGAVVMVPEKREIHAVHGLPDRNPWVTFTF